ncbi:MAG: formyltetrahydrofolate deformylase [Bacteroidota bacterium]
MKLTILIHCQDQSGIIHSTTGFIADRGGNIIYLDQHVDKQAGIFFMRLECEFTAPHDFNEFRNLFSLQVAKVYGMQWSAYQDGEKPKMALFVSKYNHCLYDILSRYRSGELDVDIPFIMSNHNDLRYIGEQFQIPYYHYPITKATKSNVEDEQLLLLVKHQIDFIVLARYMQLVSSKIIDRYPNGIINIHHSFLPAFAGAKPYHAAFERGVKIIGATSHYVTEVLDGGPIIEQDVAIVSHTHSVKDFIAKGRDLEKIVLARAIKLHLSRRTMVYNNKTVIFS